MKVLIVYATVFGSTKSIAERISTRLSTGTCSTTLHSVDATPSPPISDYDAIVIGSCIHGSKWIKPARKYLTSISQQLTEAQRPLWAFTVGAPAAIPRWGGGGAKLAAKEKANAEKMLREQGVSFKGHELFNGEWKREDMLPFARLFFGCCIGVKFGDYRDWEAVDAWADAIVKEFKVPGATEAVNPVASDQ
jgi:menaquinone-dependent protoporphyrinogen oxidase